MDKLPEYFAIYSKQSDDKYFNNHLRKKYIYRLNKTYYENFDGTNSSSYYGYNIWWCFVSTKSWFEWSGKQSHIKVKVITLDEWIECIIPKTIRENPIYKLYLSLTDTKCLKCEIPF